MPLAHDTLPLVVLRYSEDGVLAIGRRHHPLVNAAIVVVLVVAHVPRLPALFALRQVVALTRCIFKVDGQAGGLGQVDVDADPVADAVLVGRELGRADLERGDFGQGAVRIGDYERAGLARGLAAVHCFDDPRVGIVWDQPALDDTGDCLAREREAADNAAEEHAVASRWTALVLAEVVAVTIGRVEVDADDGGPRQLVLDHGQVVLPVGVGRDARPVEGGSGQQGDGRAQHEIADPNGDQQRDQRSKHNNSLGQAHNPLTEPVGRHRMAYCTRRAVIEATGVGVSPGFRRDTAYGAPLAAKVALVRCSF